MSIRQRLYPDPAQVAVMVEHCHQARFVFNIGLEQRRMWARSKHDRADLSVPRVTTASQMRELTSLRADLDWLAAGSTVVQQAALRDLDRAFTNFFAGRGSYPRFKARDERNGGFVIRDLTVTRINRRWATVTVPKLGPVRFRLTRPWADVTATTSARINRRNGTWHVSLTTPPPAKKVAGTGAVVGIDRGVANTLATSDEDMFQMPGLTTGERARFLSLERRLARQTRAAKRDGRRYSDCTNRTRTLDALAILRGRLDNRRTDFIEQTTTAFASTHDLIAVEDLRVTNMVRAPKPKPDPDNPGVWLSNNARAKATLNRLIHASRWSEFTTRLGHKTDAVVTVSAAYTSQECRECGHISSENRESQAVFVCTRCGHTNHADTNAAHVILNRGITARQHQPGDTGGSPASAAAPPRRRNHHKAVA